MLRNRIIDIAKGIAIFLVIFGHVTHVPEIRQYIWSFHIPLFFFISGVLIKANNYQNFTQYLGKKSIQLLIPYLIFYIITFLYWLILEKNTRGTELVWWSQIIGLFYGTYNLQHMFFNGALWFIPCLFSMETLYWFIAKITRWNIRLAMLIMLCLIGIYASPYLSWLPFGINAAMIGLVFLGIGNMLSPLILSGQWYSRWSSITKLLVIGILLFIQWALQDFAGADLASLKFYHPLMYIPLAIIGIALCFVISSFIKGSTVLEWLGKSSLVLFAFQEPVYRVVIYVFSKIFGENVEQIRENLLFCLCCTIITILIICPLVWGYNRVINPFIKSLQCSKY